MHRKKKVRIPKQKRSIETKNRIMDAAVRLFTAKGYHASSSNEIAMMADVPIGSFYAYFNNKKNLILELINRFNDDFYNTVFGTFDMASSDYRGYSDNQALEIIERLVSNTVNAFTVSLKFFSTIYTLQFTDKDVARLLEETRQKEMRVLINLLKNIKPLIKIENISLAAKVIHSSVENIALYINYLGSEFNREKLIKETSVMIYKYLFLSSPACLDDSGSPRRPKKKE